MPTKRKRVPVPFDDKSVVALGLDPEIDGDVSSAALAGVVARYAELMYLAAADLDRLWRRAQWLFVADCLKGTRFPVRDPAEHLTAHLAVVDAIEEAHAAHRVGESHFLNALDAAKLTVVAARKKADEKVADLCRQMRELTAIHGAAAFAAVRWYWAHEAELPADVQWWLPHVRNKLFNSRPPAPKKPKPPPKADGSGTALFSNDPDAPDE